MPWDLLPLSQGAEAGGSPAQGPHASPAREARRHTLHSCVTTPVEGAELHPTLWCAACLPPSPDMVTVWLRTPEWKVKALLGGLCVAGERGRGGRSSRQAGKGLNE